jgi:uncharacterized protein Yka (UPF0111/DUF47 family)
MAGILSYFLPKDKVFYSLFEEASNNLERIAQKLLQVVHESDFNKRAALITEMRDIEHQNDNITHEIFIELGKNFITPFDREDIHALASALDDIAEYIYASGKKINFYKIDPISDQGIQKTAAAINDAVIAVKAAVMELRNLKNKEQRELTLKVTKSDKAGKDVNKIRYDIIQLLTSFIKDFWWLILIFIILSVKRDINLFPRKEPANI